MPFDLPQRHRFALPALDKFQGNPNFPKKILFSDDTYFWLNEVSNQNYRIWVKEHPEEIQELSLHLEKSMVWCGLQGGKIIVPNILKNYDDENETVNGDHYYALITDYLMPEIASREFGNIQF